MANLFQKFTGLLQDPAPDFVFEISETGVAWARPALSVPPSFAPIEPGVLAVSPLVDNVLRMDALADQIRAVTRSGSARKRGGAVVILPDFSSRVAVLSFDQFPTDAKEQLSLVRFRMKKSVPFDVESAVVSYHIQSTGKQAAAKGKGKTDVVVALAALEIVARFEAAFRSAGLHPGLVTTASMAMIELLPVNGISVVARLSGRHLTVLVTNGSAVRLVRTVELADTSADEILAVLFPTLAYVEDEMGSPADRIYAVGFETAGVLPDWLGELQIPVEPLRSRFGAPNGMNAGLLGYLEGMNRGIVKAA